MAERIMKWDGFNIIQPQNMTTGTVGYGDLTPTDVRGSLRAIRSSTSDAPNTYIKSTSDQQKPARVLWAGLDTRGGGNQGNTGAFQVRFWIYASTGFKNIPSGFHYRFGRTYDINGEWIHCLCYRGRDLVLRTGNLMGNGEKVVWKNALSDSGWANKWHRIEFSCNNNNNTSGVRIDKRSWVSIPWGTKTWGKVGGQVKVPLASLSIGAVESDSPNNVSFRNVEVIDSYHASDFTYDWVPPVGPKFEIPKTLQIEKEVETANISVSNTSLGTAPLKSAKWYEEIKGTHEWGLRSEIKTENVATTALSDFNVVRGPYTKEGNVVLTLEVEDHYGFKVSKSTNVFIGATADTGPDISVSDKNILLGEATTVNISTVSAGTNGAEYPAASYVIIVDPYNGTTETAEENTGTEIKFGGYRYPWRLSRLDSNPDNPPVTVNYQRTGTAPWNVCTFNFGQFTKAGTYTYEFTIRNSNDIESTVSFDIVVDGVDTPEWTVNSPALPDEQGTVPEYFVGSEFDIDIDIATGNAGAPIYIYANNNLDGTDIINGKITPNGDGTYKFTGTGIVTSIQEVNGFAVGIVDSLGNTSRSDMIYYNGREVIAPDVFLTPDFLVNAQVTDSFTVEAFVTDGTFAVVPETARWDILVAPTGYNGAVTYDTYRIVFQDYDTAGNYVFQYNIEDTQGNLYTAQCNVYISLGSNTEPDAPRDILDWMSNTQLEQEATKALSGITLQGNNKQDIEWYRRQVLSLQIPNIDTMSFEEVERQYYKAIINGDLYRENGLYGVISGGAPDSVVVPDEPEPNDPDAEHDGDNPDVPDIKPDPINPPVTPEDPVTLTVSQVVQLVHDPRRVLQCFAWDQANDVWYASQVNPDSVSDTKIHKFNSAGEFQGSMNMINAGHGSSISHQRVGSADYIWTFHSAIGMDQPRSIVRGKYTNGSSLTYTASGMEKTPTFYKYYSPVNVFGNLISIRTTINGYDTYRQYNLSDYLAGKNKPIRVIGPIKNSSSYGAYQGHTSDEKYLYVHRGGSSWNAGKPSTLWDVSHLMVYRWSDGKVRDISTHEYGMSGGRSEAEGVQRYDVGGVKYIYIGKAAGATSAREYKVFRFTRDNMEAWFAANG